MTLLENLTEVLERAIATSVATSCSLAVSIGDDEPLIIIHRGHSQKSKTSEQSIYDLASVTKIVGTTLALAHALPGQITLNEVANAYFPFASVRALLAHKAGLSAHKRFYETLALNCRDFGKNRDAVFAELFASKAEEDRRVRLYSDLGFMLLGLFLEQKLKKPLEEIFADAWRASELKSTLTWYKSQPLTFINNNPHLVPTGTCTSRRTRVVGQVHDPNCYYMGGLAGHAGLFGTLSDVHACGRYFLRAVRNPHSAIRYFSRHALGFDKPTREGTTRYFSPDAFGHFGYTGTSLWIDPYYQNGRGVVITLLTNRVNVSENPAGIFWLRLTINRLITVRNCNIAGDGFLHAQD